MEEQGREEAMMMMMVRGKEARLARGGAAKERWRLAELSLCLWCVGEGVGGP